MPSNRSKIETTKLCVHHVCPQVIGEISLVLSWKEGAPLRSHEYHDSGAFYAITVLYSMSTRGHHWHYKQKIASYEGLVRSPTLRNGPNFKS